MQENIGQRKWSVTRRKKVTSAGEREKKEKTRERERERERLFIAPKLIYIKIRNTNNIIGALAR